MKNEKGQATVELALSLTVLCLLLFGIIDFGRIFMSYIDLKHSGREAARTASLGASDDAIRQAAFHATTLDSSQMTISITPALSSRTRGTYVTIQQSYPVRITVPLLTRVIPNPFIVRNKYVMRIE